MKNLYGRIVINKEFNENQEIVVENINYYKLKNSKYGFEIVKENECTENIEITNVIDITENEEKINYILNLLVNKRIMPNEPDVIEDLVKQYT